MLLIIVFLIALMEAIAQYFIRKYHDIPYFIYYSLGVLFYGIVTYLLNLSYDYSTMGMTQVLWSGFSVISILFVGSFFFGETIEMNEWVGILFILSGVGITQIKNFV